MDNVPKTEEYLPTYAENARPVQTSEPSQGHLSFHSTNQFIILSEDKEQSSRTKVRGTKSGMNGTAPIKKEATKTKACGTKSGKKEMVSTTPEKTTPIDDMLNLEDITLEKEHKHVSDLSTIHEEAEDEPTTPVVSDNECINRELVGERSTIVDEEASDDEIESTFQPGPLGYKYMAIHETVQLFQGPNSTFDEIPQG